MKKVKIIVDILMFIATILLMDIELIGFLTHEILGMVLGVLIIIHIALNFKWVKQVTKNFKSTNTKTKIMYIVNLLIMIMYFGAIICGILISDKIFKFETRSNLYIMLAHIAFGRFAIITMFIHLGMHLDRMVAKVKNKKVKIAVYVIYSIITILIAIYSIYALTQSFQWSYVFDRGW